MGSALSGIGKAVGGIIGQVAPSILKAVAPAASGLLKKLTDGFVNTGANFLKNALSALPLPSPLKALGEKLLGKGAEMLKQFAGGGIDKLIQSFGDMIMKRLAPGAGTIAPDPLNSQARQDAIANNNPGVPGSTGSNSAPSTGGTTGSNSAPATGSSSGATGSSGSTNLPPKPLSGEDAKDVSKQNAYNEQMFNYQQAMSNMNKFWEMMSTVQKSHDQTRGSMIANLR